MKWLRVLEVQPEAFCTISFSRKLSGRDLGHVNGLSGTCLDISFGKAVLHCFHTERYVEDLC